MNRHIIQKQVVELSLSEMERFHPVADAFNNIIKHSVLPKLSAQFDKLSDEQTVITANQLEIDLGIIDWEKQQEFIGDKLVELIVKKISGLVDEKKENKLSSETIILVPVSIRQWLAWKEYLETGLMPWFGATTSQQEWEATLISVLDSIHHSTIINLIHNVISNEEARKRLLLVFSLPFIEAITKTTGHATEDRLSLFRLSRWLETEMKVSTGAFEKISLNILLNHFYDSNPGISFIALLEHLICLYPYQNWLRILMDINKPSTINGVLSSAGIQKMMRYFINVLLSPIPENEFRKIIRQIPETALVEIHFSPQAFEIIYDQKIIDNRHATKNITEKNQSGIDKILMQREKKNDIALIPKKEESFSTEPLYVPYAGLVITAPFLPMLFETLGLLEEGIFRDVEAQVKGVRLASFLASGQTDTPDWELTISKILCGLDPSVTIDTEEILSEESLHEAEGLLEALIKHWKALGRCSPDGLREGFLERPGKLTAQPDNWLLQVESKTIDILLDRISWSFGTIKLPWMPKMLITEWNI